MLYHKVSHGSTGQKRTRMESKENAQIKLFTYQVLTEALFLVQNSTSKEQYI